MITVKVIKIGFLLGHHVIKLVLLMQFFVCYWFGAHSQVHYSDTELTVAQGTTHTLLVDNLEWDWKKTSATVVNGVIRVAEPQIDASGNGTVEVGLLAKKFYNLDFEDAPRVVYAVKAEISGTEVTYKSVDNYNIVLNFDKTDDGPIESTNMVRVFWADSVNNINNVRSAQANKPSRIAGSEGIEMTNTSNGFGTGNFFERPPDGSNGQIVDIGDGNLTTESSPLLKDGLTHRPAGSSDEGSVIPSEETWPEESETSTLLARGTGHNGGSVPSGPLTPPTMLSVIYVGSGVVAIITIGTAILLSSHYIKSNDDSNTFSIFHSKKKNKGKHDHNSGGSDTPTDQTSNNANPQPQYLLAYVKVTGDVTLTSVKIPGIEHPIVFQSLPITY